MRFNIDIDGVLADFVHDMRMFVSNQLGIHPMQLKDPDIWEIPKAWSIEDQWHDLFEAAVSTGAVFANAWPIPGAADALFSLKQAGHYVTIVSSKVLHDPLLTAHAVANTAAWLYNSSMLYDQVVLTGRHKVTVPMADVVIDDKPDGAWTQVLARNLLFDQPWNRSWDRETVSGATVERVSSWPEILDLLEIPFLARET
jgi:5'-nucleotidase